MGIPCLFLALSWNCPPPLCAQNQFITFSEKNWGDNPENQAYTAMKDPFGFIWFTTGNGLVRWDGQNAKLYQHDPLDSGSLRTRDLLSKGMFWNPAKREIWIPTARALSIFDPISETFTHYQPIPGDPAALPSGNVNVIRRDGRGTVWLGTAHGQLVRCTTDKNRLRFQTFTTDRTGEIRFGEKIEDIQPDPRDDSLLWIGTHKNGLIQLNTHTFRARHYFKNIPSMHTSISDIVVHPNGLLFLKNWEGELLVFDPQAEKVVRTFNNQLIPRAAFRNRSIRLPVLSPGAEHIWLESNARGLFLVDPDNFELTFVRQVTGNAGRPLKLRHLLTEENSTLWLGTNEGLLKERIYPNQVENFFWTLPEPYSETFPPNYKWPTCTGVFRQTANQIVLPVMDARGLYLFNLSDKQLEFIPQPYPSREMLVNVTSMVLLSEEEGLLAVNFKLFRIHFKTKRLEEVKLDIKAYLIHQDTDGQIWLLTLNNKLYQFDRARLSVQKTDLGKGEAFNATPKRVFADKNNNIWIDYELDKLAVYLRDKKQYLLLSGKDGGNFRPCGFSQQKDGIIYVCNYYREGANFGYINPDQPERGIHDIGWMRNICASTHRKDMIRDDKGRLWVLSKTGLEVLDLKNQSLTLLSAAHGVVTWDDMLYRNPAGEGWLMHLTGGRMAIVYRGGLGLFHTDSLLNGQNARPAPPRPYLTAIHLGGVPLAMDTSAVFKKNLVLEFKHNDVAFEYSALDHSDIQPLRFFHRLEGLDDNWLPSKGRYASYPNLPPGHYTFRVKVVLGKDETSHPLSFSLTILPPWYRTWWAYLFYTLAIGSILFVIRRYELRRQLANAEARHFKALDLAKTRLYANITHEFRTPLTVILGMEEQARKNPGAWLDEGLRLIRRNGEQLLHLVNQMLDLAKLESGHLPLRPVLGDVVSYLHYLTEAFHSYADSKDIRLHFRSDFPELYMDYDPEKLQNVMSNLLSNAIKFTPAGGDVYVDVRWTVDGGRWTGDGGPRDLGVHRPPSTVVIHVEDTGSGIAPEHLPHIFDRFYQADSGASGATRVEEGTGIGLALAKELVRLMGGNISAESEAGKGAKFSIYLPVSQLAVKTALENPPAPGKTLAGTVLLEPDTSAETPAADTGDRYLVLLVEDNADVVTYLSSVLNGYYRIVTARNGQEGIDKALELVPDVIVSDVMMPGKDGFELCRQLKTDERSSHIPIILLTARADQPSKIEGLSQGADAYLAKPFHREELLVRMEKLIELRRRLQERFQQPGQLRQAIRGGAQSAEDVFLQKVLRIVEAKLGDEDFGMPQLCKALNMSRSNLFRKLKALTGQSVTGFIRTLRLEKARELLETTDMNVTEVSYAVGFSSPGYFSRAFQAAFGVAPGKVGKK
ncbi:MAG: response regulator [Saprospirales bacterium]|nr:response regulator [Saprospirales bacterium]